MSSSVSLGMAHSILCPELLWALWPEQMFNPQESLALFLDNFSSVSQSPLCPLTSFPGTEHFPFQQTGNNTGNQKQLTCCSRKHMTEEKGFDSKQGWFCQQPVVPWESQMGLTLSLAAPAPGVGVLGGRDLGWGWYGPRSGKVWVTAAPAPW